MQTKHLTEEPLNIARLKQLPAAKKPAPPIVVLIYPGDDSFLPLQAFRRLAVWPGVTYIVVKCGPFGDTSLSTTLQEFTIIPVVEAERDMPVEPNHVYVVQPEMTIQQKHPAGQLQFCMAFPAAHGDGAIETLLASVAAMTPDSHIVLLATGMTSRLAGALRVVRDQGGFSIALTDDAPFYFDPNAVKTSDLTLSVSEATTKVQTLMTRLKKQEPLLLDSDAEKAALAHIYLLLLQNHGIDFARHRQKEVLRRIYRRMIIHDIATVENYVSRLLEDEEEMSLLFEDLRMSPTGFFLDAATEYALLNDILPGILSHRQGDYPLRIWIPCCTGGQLAYSLAMFLSEYLRERKLQLPVQIFATDLNKAATERARIGAYQAPELAGMAARKRKRYFTRLPDGGHQINQTIREVCVFATHNLQKDPPFSHVDLIVASSTMAGLSPESMDRIFRNFHYALNPYGYLLIGNGESPKSYPSALFRQLRASPCILTRNDISGKTEPSFPVQPIRKLGEQEASDVLLSGYIPPTLLVDEQLRILRFYGHTEPYLRLAQDRLSLHLLRMVRDELVFELDELIERSAKEEKTVIKEGVLIGSGESSRPLSIEVTPLRNFGSRWKLIIIREMNNSSQLTTPVKAHGRTLTAKDIRILALEKEVNELRALLVAANQESGRIQETLQHANEDILASNEELTSVNEQLRSVNQQLLSFNIELNTVNEDLYVRNHKLEVSGEYAHAIVRSIRRPLVVLQDDLRIRLANPSFHYFLGIPETETQGQSLYTIAGGALDRDDLRKAIRQSLTKKITSMDFELRVDIPGQGERILAINLSRIQNVKNIRTGLILALDDITERKMTEKYPPH